MIVAFVLLVLPVYLFLRHFYQSEFSQDQNDWQTFAVYFSGTVGTIGSLVFGFFIYKSFTLQNKQRIEETLFNYLNAFSKEKDKKQAELIAKELEMFKSVESLNPEEMKTPYFKLLEEYFIVKYSRDSATPRLHIDLTMYFKFVNSLCYLIHTSKLSNSHFKQVKMFLLSQFHDSEIKMICYYYYLFFDVVNSTDAKFKCTNNIVKRSGLFEDDLSFSDDFTRNHDPRKGAFESQLNSYRAKVGSKRPASD